MISPEVPTNQHWLPSRICGMQSFYTPSLGPVVSSYSLIVEKKAVSYIFSFNVDFFNVKGNHQCNTTTSCSIISCTCLNLPVDLRYKPENMYLTGIIPGPHEPPGDQLNFFLDPLVNNMMESWGRGVRFSHTATSGQAHITRSAIVCVICDLPAARKTAQLVAATSHFYCSACHCFHLLTLGRMDTY
jgi:hypothetical protein